MNENEEELNKDHETNKFGKFKTKVDFEYEYDLQRNPTLLISHSASERTRRDYSRVEYDHTVTYVYHAPDFAIRLPSDFDLSYFRSLDRTSQIACAEKRLTRETIVNSQNAL